MNNKLMLAKHTVTVFRLPLLPLYQGEEEAPGEGITRQGSIDGVGVYLSTIGAEITLGAVSIPTVPGEDAWPRLAVWQLPSEPTPDDVTFALSNRPPLVVYERALGVVGSLSEDDAVSTLVGVHVPTVLELRWALEKRGIPSKDLDGKGPQRLFLLALALGALRLPDVARAEAAYGPHWHHG